MTAILFAYLLASVLFVIGLKYLSHPRTAVRGNLLGAVGMLIAIVVTLLDRQILRFEYILIGLVLGSAAGTILALRIRMTAMPQLVALLNGFGGIASAFVAGAVLMHTVDTGRPAADAPLFIVSTAASGLVGAVTFWGSLVAFGKLQGLVTEKPVRYRGEQIVKVLVFIVSLYFAIGIASADGRVASYWIMSAVASLLGVILVIPIGGADMPIVIALLNSYSGIAAAATGFVLGNSVLIIAGALVGASGIFLTSAMCKAMNRSLPNVLFGGVGEVIEEEAESGDIYAGRVKATSPEEVAMLLSTSRRVVFVPGYGLAVARAQTAVRLLTEALEADGIEVEFGIHPVAGRMPGHMNVLLAEENIPYDKLKEMDDINGSFPQTDMVIVVGANDVVNPLAREASGSPISGMPILNVDQARTVVVVKRSLSPGFAGIHNPLFVADNTLMLFADAKKALEAILHAYKEQ
jgi:NAD(P) transhydrogenase subunit beta